MTQTSDVGLDQYEGSEILKSFKDRRAYELMKADHHNQKHGKGGRYVKTGGGETVTVNQEGQAKLPLGADRETGAKHKAEFVDKMKNTPEIILGTRFGAGKDVWFKPEKVTSFIKIKENVYKVKMEGDHKWGYGEVRMQYDASAKDFVRNFKGNIDASYSNLSDEKDDKKAKIVPYQHSAWIKPKYADRVDDVEAMVSKHGGEFGNGTADDGMTFHFADREGLNSFIKESKKEFGVKALNVSDDGGVPDNEFNNAKDLDNVKKMVGAGKSRSQVIAHMTDKLGYSTTGAGLFLAKNKLKPKNG